TAAAGAAVASNPRDRGSAQACPGPVNQHLEGLAVADRQIGQHLAVDLDARPLQATDEAAVRQPALPGRGVDPGDPQPAEIPLPLAPVPEGVGQRLEDLFIRRPEGLALATVVAPGELENLLMAAALPRAAPDTRHEFPSSINRSGTGEQAPEPAGIRTIHVTRPAQAPLAVHRLLRQQVRPVGPLHLPLARPGPLETLPRTAVRLHLGHRDPPYRVSALGARIIDMLRPSMVGG